MVRGHGLVRPNGDVALSLVLACHQYPFGDRSLVNSSLPVTGNNLISVIIPPIPTPANQPQPLKSSKCGYMD